MSSVYQLNKGINKAIEFRGLKAQYITYLAVGLVTLLILFAVLYISGVNTYICLFFVGGSGTTLIMTVFRLSHKYGQYGLLKKNAKRSLPDYLKFRSRKLSINLKRNRNGQH